VAQLKLAARHLQRVKGWGVGGWGLGVGGWGLGVSDLESLWFVSRISHSMDWGCMMKG